LDKEIKQAVTERIKSPYFGYSVLAFISINWQSFFLLLVSEGNAKDRLDAFNHTTNYFILFILPLFVGFFVAVISPFIQEFFRKIHKETNQRSLTIDYETESKMITVKTKFDEARSNEQARVEKDIIDRAKRDSEVMDVKDPEIQKELKATLDGMRSFEKTNKNFSKSHLTKLYSLVNDMTDRYSYIQDQKFTVPSKIYKEELVALRSEAQVLSNKIIIGNDSNLYEKILVLLRNISQKLSD
jgi:hypothetical protein